MHHLRFIVERVNVPNIMFDAWTTNGKPATIMHTCIASNKVSSMLMTCVRRGYCDLAVHSYASDLVTTIDQIAQS